VNTLWYKYHSYEQWGLVAWANIVAAAATDASIDEDSLKERGLDEDAHVHLLLEVHERLGDGLGPAIIQWLKANAANPSNLAALLSNPASFARLLVFAVLHDIVPMALVLSEFVCPILGMLHRFPSPGPLGRCLVWVLYVLLTPPSVDNHECRVGRVDAEHLHARRSLTFSPGLFPCIVNLTALLVKCENVVLDRDAAPEVLRQEFVDLRRAIWKDPVFRAAFLCEPQVSMRTILNSEADDAMRGRLLDALLDALGEADTTRKRIVVSVLWRKAGRG
jgi:hypothetical protein